MNHPIRFTLNYPTVGKARPRVTANGTFFPPAYKAWRKKSITDLRSQRIYIERQHKIAFPFECPVALHVAFWGRNSGDGDNCQGAIMDSLVHAGILSGDTFKRIPEGSWHRFPKSKRKWAEIIIIPALKSAAEWRESFPLSNEEAA